MFVKLYNSLILSSLWSEASDTRVLWITMLAAADRDGYIFGSPAGLAALARLPVQVIIDGLKVFSEPDPLSTDLLRNPQNEGRRIEVVDGGWRLLNYDWYRGLERAEDRKAQYRESKARQRGGRVERPQMSRAVSKSPPSEAEAEAEAEANTETGGADAPALAVGGNGHKPRARAKGFSKPFVPPTLADVRGFVAEKPELANINPDEYWEHYETQNWLKGNGIPVGNWKLLLRTWSKNPKNRKAAP